MADNTVLIGCKHPSGLILNLDVYKKINEMGGVQRVTGTETVTLRGWSMPLDPKARQARDRAYRREGIVLEGGYALTPVPVAFWDAWLKKNVGSPLLKDRIILPPHADAEGQALAHEKVEPMFRQGDESGKDSRAPGVERDFAEAAA